MNVCMDVHIVMYLSTVLVILVDLSLIVSLYGEVPYLVSRRVSGDIIVCNATTFEACVDGNTFLVSERQCVSNEELFNDCSLAITASEEPLIYRLIISIQLYTQQSNNSVESTAAHTLSSQYTITDAVVIHEQNLMKVNSSFCHIASLEVYRGREQAIEISHQGFTLSYGGTIEINHTLLAYNHSTEEYVGELYRMNLSCSGGGLPESGCLFFKVVGVANVTNAKFNCTLPGTLTDFMEECNKIITTKGTEPTPITTALLPTSNNVIIPIVVAPVGSVIILIMSITIACIVIRSHRRKRQSNLISNVITQQQNQDATLATLQPSKCQKNPAYITSSQAALVSGSYSENPAHNIGAQPSSHQEPTYEVIPLERDKSPHTIPGTLHSIRYSQNPAYAHLGVHVKESSQTDPTSPCDYSQNPAYGVHSSPNYQ